MSRHLSLGQGHVASPSLPRARRVSGPDSSRWPTHCDWCLRRLDKHWTFVGGNPHCDRNDCFYVTHFLIERERNQMGTRLTSSEHTTALYDSVTGRAFGEVFETEDEATAFLEYATRNGFELREPRVYASARTAWLESPERRQLATTGLIDA